MADNYAALPWQPSSFSASVKSSNGRGQPALSTWPAAAANARHNPFRLPGRLPRIGPAWTLATANHFRHGVSGSDGNLYGVDSGSPSNLFEINTTTGVATPAGGIALSDKTAIGAVADASGKLYVIDKNSPGSLYTLQPPSSTTTTIRINWNPERWLGGG